MPGVPLSISVGSDEDDGFDGGGLLFIGSVMVNKWCLSYIYGKQGKM